MSDSRPDPGRRRRRGASINHPRGLFVLEEASSAGVPRISWLPTRWEGRDDPAVHSEEDAEDEKLFKLSLTYFVGGSADRRSLFLSSFRCKCRCCVEFMAVDLVEARR